MNDHDFTVFLYESRVRQYVQVHCIQVRSWEIISSSPQYPVRQYAQLFSKELSSVVCCTSDGMLRLTLHHRITFESILLHFVDTPSQSLSLCISTDYEQVTITNKHFVLGMHFTNSATRFVFITRVSFSLQTYFSRRYRLDTRISKIIGIVVLSNLCVRVNRHFCYSVFTWMNWCSRLWKFFEYVEVIVSKLICDRVETWVQKKNDLCESLFNWYSAKGTCNICRSVCVKALRGISDNNIFIWKRWKKVKSAGRSWSRRTKVILYDQITNHLIEYHRSLMDAMRWKYVASQRDIAINVDSCTKIGLLERIFGLWEDLRDDVLDVLLERSLERSLALTGDTEQKSNETDDSGSEEQNDYERKHYTTESRASLIPSSRSSQRLMNLCIDESWRQ